MLAIVSAVHSPLTSYSLLPTTQFAYQICLDNCVVLLHVSHTLHSIQEARIVLIDFSAAFDRVNHQGILNNPCCVGIGGSVLSVLMQFIKTINVCYGGWLLE